MLKLLSCKTKRWNSVQFVEEIEAQHGDFMTRAVVLVRNNSRGYYVKKHWHLFVLTIPSFALFLLSYHSETEKSYNFFRANQQKANLKFYSWTQHDFRVNRCDWRILVGNENCLNWRTSAMAKATRTDSITMCFISIFNPVVPDASNPIHL